MPKNARREDGTRGTRRIFTIDWSGTTHTLMRLRAHSIKHGHSTAENCYEPCKQLGAQRTTTGG